MRQHLRNNTDIAMSVRLNLPNGVHLSPPLPGLPQTFLEPVNKEREMAGFCNADIERFIPAKNTFGVATSKVKARTRIT